GSFPSNPSRNFHADAVTRSWRNKERSRAFTSRNDDAQSSSVASTDAPAIHDPPNHGGPWIQKSKENATVMLEPCLWHCHQGEFVARSVFVSFLLVIFRFGPTMELGRSGRSMMMTS